MRTKTRNNCSLKTFATFFSVVKLFNIYTERLTGVDGIKTTASTINNSFSFDLHEIVDI